MKPIEIFRVGKHTAASGAALSFSEDDLRAAVDAYDPAVHEAPIVVGHPRDNHPAYGWVKALSFSDGIITAEPIQVDEAFAEMVTAGRFKKRSASFYAPDSPNNPKPGTYYLRHVGFLGAQPPAVKGLRDVEFSAADDGVVEFSSSERWAFGSIAAMFRGLREWLIAEKGAEAADKALPNYLLGDVERASNEDDPAPTAAPTFAEEDPMKIEELQAQVAALTAERDQLKAQAGQAADFAEREAGLQAREAALAAEQARIDRATVDARVQAAVKAGRVVPAKAKQIADFAMGLAAGEATIDFGEGDKAEKITQREAYMRQIEAGPVVVDYSERAAGAGTPPDGVNDPAVIAEKARELVEKATEAGKSLSFTEAVAQATTELAG